MNLNQCKTKNIMNLLQRIFKNDNSIIQEIHDSFDKAQDQLLEEAIAIINSHCPSDKADRLEKLGFVNSKVVKHHQEKQKTFLKSKEDAELVKHYKFNYPFLKFLKEDQLDAICDKYGLVYTTVDRYKEDVPEKNLAEIESAKPLDESDGAEQFVRVLSRQFEYTEIAEYEEFKRKHPDGIVGFPYALMDEKSVEHHIKKRYDFFVGRYEELYKEGLFIAAPKSHFNLNGLKNTGKSFFKSKIIEVKDPIVFRYVKGGIQVLSKWGLEASDESLVNEIYN